MFRVKQMPIIETTVIHVRPLAGHLRQSPADARLEAAHKAVARAALAHIRRFPLEKTVVLGALDAPTFPFGKGVEKANRFDLMTYGNSLISKGMARSSRSDGDTVRIDLTDVGFKALKAEAAARTIRPAVPAAEREKLSGSAKALLTPMLRHITGHAMPFGELVQKLAREFSIPLDEIEQPIFEGNHSLATLAHAGIAHLWAKELLISAGKQIGSSPLARDLATRRRVPTWDDFVEPAPVPDKVAVAKKAERMMGSENVLSKIPGMTMDELMALWQNGHKVFTSAKSGSNVDHAQAVIVAVSAEWARRGPVAKSESFRWPDTEIRHASEERQNAMFPNMQEQGMLSYMEYHVGAAIGQTEGVRRNILAMAYVMPLPQVFDAPYMAEWGTDASPRRLRKIATSIASFCRIAKRRDSSDMRLAISEWEADLAFLKQNFYRPSLGFEWPRTSVPGAVYANAPERPAVREVAEIYRPAKTMGMR